MKSARAPLRARTYAASAPRKRVLIGTSTPPAVVTPSAATIHSSEFGAHTATRSPRSMPDAMQRARRVVDQLARSVAKSTRAVAVDDRLGVAARDRAPCRGPSRESSATATSLRIGASAGHVAGERDAVHRAACGRGSR